MKEIGHLEKIINEIITKSNQIKLNQINQSNVQQINVPNMNISNVQQTLNSKDIIVTRPDPNFNIIESIKPNVLALHALLLNVVDLFIEDIEDISNNIISLTIKENLEKENITFKKKNEQSEDKLKQSENKIKQLNNNINSNNYIITTLIILLIIVIGFYFF